MELEVALRLGVESRYKASVKQRESGFGLALLSHSVSRWVFWILRVAFSLMGEKILICQLLCGVFRGFFVLFCTRLIFIERCKHFAKNMLFEKLNIAES